MFSLFEEVLKVRQARGGMSSTRVKQEATMKPLLTHQPRGKATLDPIYVNKFKQGQLLPLGIKKH